MEPQEQKPAATIENDILVGTPVQPSVAPKKSKKLRIIAIIAAALVLAGIGVGIFIINQNAKQQPAAKVNKTFTKPEYLDTYSQAMSAISTALAIDAGTYTLGADDATTYFRLAAEKASEYQKASATLRSSLKSLYAKDAVLYDETVRKNKDLFANNMDTFLESVDAVEDTYGIIVRDYGNFESAYDKGRKTNDWSIKLDAIVAYRKVLENTTVRGTINTDYLKEIIAILKENEDIYRKYIASDKKTELDSELTTKFNKIYTSIINHTAAVRDNASKYAIDGGQAGGLQIALFKRTLEASTTPTAVKDNTAVTPEEFQAVFDTTLSLGKSYGNVVSESLRMDYADNKDNVFRQEPQKIALEFDTQLRALGNLKAVQLDKELHEKYEALIVSYKKNIDRSVLLSEVFMRDSNLIINTLRNRDPATATRFIGLYDKIIDTMNFDSTRKYIIDAKPYMEKMPDLLTRCHAPNNDQAACADYTKEVSLMNSEALSKDVKDIMDQSSKGLISDDLQGFSLWAANRKSGISTQK